MSNETAVEAPGGRPGPQPPQGTARPASAAAGPPPAAPAPLPQEHRYDVDLMRLLCSCAVMLGHVGAQFIAAVERREANGPGAYWAGHVAEALNPFAVPMYFAIAGWAVLVGAPPRDGRRMARRVVRNTVPLFVWTALYLLWGRVLGTNEDPLPRLALDSLLGSVRPAYHLWFMYAYIPLIVALAFAVLVRAGKRPWGLGAALLALALAPEAVADLERWTGWDLPRVGWGFGVYQVVYAAGGALLFSLPARVPRGRRWPLVALMLLAMAGALWYNTQVHYVIPNAHLFVAVLTCCVLLLVNRVEVPGRWQSLVSRLAGAALGAYMVHVMVISVIVGPLASPDLSGPVAGALLVALLAATIAVSFGASLLWGRLGLRAYLG